LATGRVERRLAAILAADVAGYSRLMGVDEEGTLARLKALRRELADPKIKEHRGRIAAEPIFRLLTPAQCLSHRGTLLRVGRGGLSSSGASDPIAVGVHGSLEGGIPGRRPPSRSGSTAYSRTWRASSRAALLCRRVPGPWPDLPSRAGAADEQSRRELAPGRATAGAENAALQIGRLRATVSQRPRRRHSWAIILPPRRSSSRLL